MLRVLDRSRSSIVSCALALTMLVATGGARAATFKVLYTFQGGSDGAYPEAGVIADKAGNLYGTTWEGGSGGDGTAFRLAPDGSETVLHSFAGVDGLGPAAGLIADKAGNLYGATAYGGSTGTACGGGGCGTVFKLAPDGTETVLYSFKGGRDGFAPSAGLIWENGNLYGTTSFGGGRGCFQQEGCGTVFKVARDGTETVLHAFFRDHSGGSYPDAGLVADSAGNLYGTTSQGGTACVVLTAGCGTAFRLAPDGTETVLYAFHGKRGTFPLANLILDKAGNLYGTTSAGGSHDNNGTVFKLAPDGTETVLYSFCNQKNCSDGSEPHGGVIADKAGNLYGTTLHGGSTGTACGSLGCGTVFKLAPDGTETLLYTFTGGTDGSSPYVGLLLRQGYLYGTAGAAGGGSCQTGCGTVFSVKL